MTDSPSSSFSSVIVLVALAAAALCGAAALWWLGPDRGTQGNPYAYDLTPYAENSAPDDAYVERSPIDTGLDFPSAIAVSADGRLLATGGAEIVSIPLAGGATRRFDIGETATCLAAGPNGVLYVGCADHVEILDASGALREKWTSLGDKAFLTSISVAPGDVGVADAGQRRVWRFDEQGRVKAILGRQPDEENGFVVPSPYFDVAHDDAGRLWVVNPGRRRLERYDGRDRRVFQFGKSSMEPDGFSGCCNPTHMVIGPGGRCFTAEKGLVRIKRYDLEGKFNGILAGPKDFDEGTVGLDLATDSRGRLYVLDPGRKQVRVFAPRAPDGSE